MSNIPEEFSRGFQGGYIPVITLKNYLESGDLEIDIDIDANAYVGDNITTINLIGVWKKGARVPLKIQTGKFQNCFPIHNEQYGSTEIKSRKIPDGYVKNRQSGKWELKPDLSEETLKGTPLYQLFNLIETMCTLY